MIRGVLTAALTSFTTLASAWSMTLVHMNDTHSHVEPTVVRGKSYGGFARIKTLIDQARKEDPNTVVLHAGDAFQGTLYFNIYKGVADGFLLNQLGIDAMCLGNHEFDERPEGLLPFTRQVDFPLLSANLDFSAYPELQKRILPYTILKRGKERLGVIGLMTPDLPEISSNENVKMVEFHQSLSSAIAALESQGINKIIALSHCGYFEDLDTAKKHPNLDLIVGGHSHSYLGSQGPEGFPNPLGAYPTVQGKTLVVQAWEWGKILGKLKIDFDKKGTITKWSGAPILVDESIPSNPQIVRALDAFAKPIENLRKSVVGEAKSSLERSAGGGLEMPLGNLIADAQLEFTKPQGAVIAMMNPGGIRSAIEAGQITFDEAISVQPFGNTLVVIDLTGAEIVEALNQMLAKGGALQVSKGLTYFVWDNKAGGVALNGASLDPNKTYRCTVNSFLSKGGDGITAFSNAKGYRYDTGNLDIDALVAFLKANSPVEAAAQGRITKRQW